MAGGKQTPRQKMINLMYLVFIAMLALNMSKEVLSAFGLMNEQFEESNKGATTNNDALYAGIAAKASEAGGGEFAGAKVMADKVKSISAKFTAYIESLKGDVTKDVEKNENGKLPYEAMDKGDKIDEGWFAGDGYSPKGNEIIATIEKYKSEIKAAVGTDKKYQGIVSEVESKFSTKDVKDGEGVTKKYLDYHYKGFPSIASLTKLSAMQNSVKVIETNVYNAALGKALANTASMSNYTAIVVLDKNAYFQGEKVTGKVVLGRYDPDTKPTSFKGPGKIENGQAVINMTAGGVGEQAINGEFSFLEDGKNIPLKFEGKYVVVPRPNSATISADKMNVVYRGVPNPISVSFAGIGADKVSASAPGMRSAGKPGQYLLSAGDGKEVVVSVTGTLPNGDKVSDKKMFRIKGLPAPVGKVRGEINAKGQKSNLEVVTVSADMEDFDFPVSVNVTQFNLKVPGQPTIVVQGNKMDSRARAAIQKAGRGDVVVISEIKAKFTGIDQIVKRVSTCTYEVQ